MIVWTVTARRWTHSFLLAIRETEEEAVQVANRAYKHVGQEPPIVALHSSDGRFTFQVSAVDTRDSEEARLEWLEDL